MNTQKPTRITPAQARIAALVHAGFTNSEIAETTNLSLSTVKNHINAIYKTGPVNREELKAVCADGVLGAAGALKPQYYRDAGAR